MQLWDQAGRKASPYTALSGSGFQLYFFSLQQLLELSRWMEPGEVTAPSLVLSSSLPWANLIFINVSKLGSSLSLLKTWGPSY